MKWPWSACALWADDCHRRCARLLRGSRGDADAVHGLFCMIFVKCVLAARPGLLQRLMPPAARTLVCWHCRCLHVDAPCCVRPAARAPCPVGCGQTLTSGAGMTRHRTVDLDWVAANFTSRRRVTHTSQICSMRTCLVARLANARGKTHRVTSGN